MAFAPGALSSTIPPRPALFQPVNLGFTFSTPFNLANVLSQDIAGPVSIALTALFGVAILAGAIVLPIAAWKGFRLQRVSRRRRKRNIFINDRTSINEVLDQLDIAETLHLMDNQDEVCHRKVVCQVHSLLREAPKKVKIVYAFFSRRVMIDKFEEPIRMGLRGEDCIRQYSRCPKKLPELLAGTSPIKEFLILLRKNSPYFPSPHF